MFTSCFYMLSMRGVSELYHIIKLGIYEVNSNSLNLIFTVLIVKFTYLIYSRKHCFSDDSVRSFTDILATYSTFDIFIQHESL